MRCELNHLVRDDFTFKIQAVWYLQVKWASFEIIHRNNFTKKKNTGFLGDEGAPEASGISMNSGKWGST